MTAPTSPRSTRRTRRTSVPSTPWPCSRPRCGANLPGPPATDEPAAPPPELDTAALDAIADEPFDEPDLFAAVDEADPVVESRPAPRPVAEDADGHDEDAGIVEQVPARTVPGAHRPA